MNPRYFIGINLPEILSRSISQVQAELFPGHKVMPTLQPHITLLHPGMTESVSPIYLLPKVRKIASSFLPIEIQLSEVAMFDQRVLYIVVNNANIMNLYDSLVDTLPNKIRAQYTVGKTYSPHVTLIQSKPKQTLDAKLVSDFKQRVDAILPCTFVAYYLSYFKWLSPRTYQIKKI